MTTATQTPYGLADYVHDVEEILECRPAMPITIKQVSTITKKLVAADEWLESRCRIGSDECYARHLLHRDRFNRFVVLSLVWQPGQVTPIHDHSCWGVMGMLEGSLEVVDYERLDDGSRPDYADLRESGGTEVAKGSVGYVLPPYHEIHTIGNVSDKPAISIHIYGRDLDVINVYDNDTKKVSPMRIKYYGPNCGGTEFMI